MKKLLLFYVVFLSAFISRMSYSQAVKLSTPLDHFVFETAFPKSADHLVMVTSLGDANPTLIQVDAISLGKYFDIPLYASFGEVVHFFDFSSLGSMANVTRTSSYVSYELLVREDEVYSRDTFYLSGTTITSITEVIYKESGSEKKLMYDVFYDANDRIKEIKLKSSSLTSIEIDDFAGLKVTYNENGIIESDSIYEVFENSQTEELEVKRSSYDHYYYNSSNPLKVDSSLNYSISMDPNQSIRYKFTTNGGSEITNADIYTYDEDSKEFKMSGRLSYGKITSVLSELKSSDKIIVYPNPVSSTLFVSGSDAAKTWSIMDQKGNVGKSGNYNIGEGVPVEDLVNGQYFLYLNNEKEGSTGKFIK